MARWLWVSWGVILCMTMAPAIGGDAPVALTDRPASPGMVAQLTLDGPIGPAAAEYFDEASKRAVADGAAAIVLRLDTPGGLLDSMRQIIARMLACKIPVLVYVAPDGARAASAGTYILYAGQIAAMAPATHVGAATPVSVGGSAPAVVRQAGRQWRFFPAEAGGGRRCRIAQDPERCDRLYSIPRATSRAQRRVGGTGRARRGNADRRRSGRACM